MTWNCDSCDVGPIQYGERCPRCTDQKSPADILRKARPDPHTRKVSFLLGWDAAIAELERNG